MNLEQSSSSTTKKFHYLAYGLASYTIGVSGLLALIFGMGGFVPLGEVFVFTSNAAAAVLVNFILVGLFAVQHTIMARQNFKTMLARYIPSACERSTFVLLTGVIALSIVAFWQPVGGVIWQADSFIAKVFSWSAFAFGWTYLLASTFAINHFDLFGLRQTYLGAMGRPYTELVFKQRWMYSYSRHPIMLGALIGFWAAPTMTATSLTLAVFFTTYVFVGIGFEERDLIKTFGDSYRSYKQKVGMFVSFGH